MQEREGQVAQKRQEKAVRCKQCRKRKPVTGGELCTLCIEENAVKAGEKPPAKLARVW